MYNIVKKDQNKCFIYKSGFIDAATCIIKGKEADPEIAMVAENELEEMFENIFETFTKKEQVRMYFLKRADSDFIDFESIYKFRLWLISRQASDSVAYILDKLNLFYKNKNKPLAQINILLGDDYLEEFYQKPIFNTEMYFYNCYDKEWFKEDIVKKMVLDIDKSRVINGETIESPVLGTIPPTKLSGGVKTLMLIYNNPDMIFNASTCGDNCAKWIQSISSDKNCVINLYHAMKFKNKFRAYIVNSDKVISSMKDLYYEVDKYCRG